jgi:hypothetical protein
MKINDTFDPFLNQYVKSKLKDFWVGTNFEGYSFLHSKQKGDFGEHFIERYMKNNGSVVLPKLNTGHDRVIDGIKTEIKFSLSAFGKKGPKEDHFFINHVSIGKDWTRLIFCGINFNLDKSRIVWFTKEDFENEIIKFFERQQGGKKMTNDDFKMSGDLSELFKHPLVKHINDWNNHA